MSEEKSVYAPHVQRLLSVVWSPCMSTGTAGSAQAIARDYQNREFTTSVALNVRALADFVEKFGKLDFLCVLAALSLSRSASCV